MSNDLGDFLRARRAAAGPDPDIRAVTNRRRVSGLRREEVAAAAGISVDYYIRLEQGRETHPSDAVLEALVRVLRLTPDGREHLYRLRGLVPSIVPGVVDDEQPLRDRVTALVEAVRPNPAYVLDRSSNMIAANPEGLALFDGFADLPSDQRNTCRYLISDPRARAIFVEWDEIARGAVAHLRSANADDLQRAELRSLVAELSSQSSLFAEWWNEHIVERRRTSIKHILVNGDVVARRHEVLYLPEDNLRMTLWLTPGGV